MANTIQVRDAAEVEQAIRAALAGGKTLEIVGRGTKRAIGRAAQWDATLDLSALSGVTLYEPQELVQRATGSKIDPGPYLRYLRGKFGDIYELT